jgi:hypothetical protein
MLGFCIQLFAPFSIYLISSRLALVALVQQPLSFRTSFPDIASSITIGQLTYAQYSSRFLDSAQLMAVAVACGVATHSIAIRQGSGIEP